MDTHPLRHISLGIYILSRFSALFIDLWALYLFSAILCSVYICFHYKKKLREWAMPPAKKCNVKYFAPPLFTRLAYLWLNLKEKLFLFQIHSDGTIHIPRLHIAASFQRSAIYIFWTSSSGSCICIVIEFS